MRAFTAACPHCSKAVAFNALRGVPSKEKVKWYQLTPRPQVACPVCGGLVISTVSNSPWLWLVMSPIVMGLLALFVPALSFLAHGWWFLVWWAPTLIGGLLAVGTGRLLPYVRQDKT